MDDIIHHIEVSIALDSWHKDYHNVWQDAPCNAIGSSHLNVHWASFSYRVRLKTQNLLQKQNKNENRIESPSELVMHLPLTCHSQCCSPSTDSNLLSYTEFSEPSASSSLTCNFSIGQWWGKRGQTALVAYETGKQEIHGNPGYLLIPHTKITSNAQSLCVRLWLDRIFLDTDPVYKLSRARTSLLRIKGGIYKSLNKSKLSSLAGKNPPWQS